ncbi:AbrB family looped-hinge helix DNA binding protein [Sphingomonas jinjuensis]|uniref:AbrB family looped-hinge helix DNA binding protein n=1 Tax=Sphingomonas jinjuensis TaxID=535907 RepID=A0A840FIS8_9SPHN|nr:AbrB family looped-hinge helix DNA binding protein [Sphingomonas jinjuensis]
MSEKGQVVVPKAVRDRLGWSPGTDLDVVETVDGVMLRRRRAARKTISPDEAVARFKQIYRHAGSAVTLEEMDQAVRDEADRRADRG